MRTSLTKLRRSTRPTAFTIASLVLIAIAGPSQAKVLYSWVQLVPDGSIQAPFGARALVRAIVERADACPKLLIGEAADKVELSKRRKPQSGKFKDIEVCEALIDEKHSQRFTQAAFDGQSSQQLTLPDLSQGVPLSFLLVFGDTGCRNKKNQKGCKDGKDWPFEILVNDAVKRRAATDVPPVVVHVGDFRYASTGKNDAWKLKKKEWGGWQDEFFKPADKLLRKVLWIPIRGNHEACASKEAGAGWAYFFHHGQETCDQIGTDGEAKGVLAPYALDAKSYSGTAEKPVWGNDTIRLVIMDSAQRGFGVDQGANDNKEADRVTALYAARMDEIDEKFVKSEPGTKAVWLFSHVPLFSLNGTEFKSHVMLDALNDSSLNDRIAGISLMVSGHRHEFELVNAGAGNPATRRPVQYVVGNSGVELSGKAELQPPTLVCDDAKVTWDQKGRADQKVTENWAVMRRGNFGYLLADVSAGGFQSKFDMKFYDIKKKDWQEDESVNCASDSGDPARIFCPGLPRMEATPKCPN